MSNIIIDIEQLFDKTTGDIIKIPGNKAQVTDKNLLTNDMFGVEVWLPVYFEDLPDDVGDKGRLFLPYTVVRISGSSTIVRTPLAERRGTVKELYNTDDYKINIKGFFIDKEKRLFPEKDLSALKKIHEYGHAFKLVNALTDIFLADKGVSPLEQNKVIISAFELPEVEGGRKVRPFTMTLESDSVFTLEVK